MLEEILTTLHNRFAVEGPGLSGTFRVSSGALTPAPEVLQEGQWYWLDGSIFNDGLHQHPAEDLTDETFRGTLTPAAIPRAVLRLSQEIEAWVADHPPTEKASESFGGYSYSVAAGQSGAPIGWQEVFSSRLSKWRKLG